LAPAAGDVDHRLLAQRTAFLADRPAQLDLVARLGVAVAHRRLGPKWLARTYRFAATVFAINPAGPVDWGDLAGGAGYFDQAHFGHEFRAFTGLTPTRYVEVRRRFLREHPGHELDSWPLPAD